MNLSKEAGVICWIAKHALHLFHMFITKLFFMTDKVRQTRRAKLHSKWRPIPTDWFSVTTGKQVPWLNVSGHWLEQAGFHIGDAVEIIVEDNVLTIKNAGHGDH